MTKSETAPHAAHATYSVPLSTPRGTTVVEPSRFYPHYYESQYVQPTPQYVQPTPQYVQPTPQYVQPTHPTPQYATEQYQFPQYQYPPQYYPQYHQYPPQYYPQFPQYIPDGCYCEIQYVIPYIVSKSNSPVSSSQPPETQQESLVVSM